MAKTRTEKIEEMRTEIAQKEARIKQLLQQQKEQERRERTRRLIERGAILESLIEGAATLTNDQIKAFLEKTIQTEYGKKTLATVTAQGGTATAQSGGNGTGAAAS